MSIEGFDEIRPDDEIVAQAQEAVSLVAPASGSEVSWNKYEKAQDELARATAQKEVSEVAPASGQEANWKKYDRAQDRLANAEGRASIPTEQ
jgi:hypothetical protein